MESPDKKSVYTKNLGKSLQNSLEGLFLAVQKESSLKILIVLGLLLILAGFLFQVSGLEWLFIALMIGCCFGAELFNTAIENVVDLVTDEKKLKAKRAKDAAAGAVLVAVIFAVIIGIGIFLPRLLNL